MRTASTQALDSMSTKSGRNSNTSSMAAGGPVLSSGSSASSARQIRLLLDVPAEEFVKAIDKGIARNTAQALQPALAERRALFDAQVGQVNKGDVVNLDFVPGQGLLFTLNGQPRGAALPGEDFYAAVLGIFIGEQPVDDRLKVGLLGGPA
jgi:hypothetical protein